MHPLPRQPEAPAGPTPVIAGASRWAVENLHARHGDAVRRLCRSIVADEHDAADAFQDAWMRAFVALAADDPPIRELRPWLFQVARNACFDVLARRARPTLAAVEPPGPPTPEESCFGRQGLRAVLDDVQALPVRQREALVLRELGGLDHSAIARRLCVSPENSRFLVAAARRTLRNRRDLRDQIDHQEAA
jgi:RNA polymerase sigma factor (sigma-70 family)